jgi:hypothetical protein
MPGIPNPANINVVVGAPGNINVQLVDPIRPRITTLEYGGRTIKSASDLEFHPGEQDGDVIAYQANTNSFILERVDALQPYSVDGGLF